MPDDLDEAEEEIRRHLEDFQRRFQEARNTLEADGRRVQRDGQRIQQDWQRIERDGRTIWRRESSTTTILEPAQRQLAADALNSLDFPALPPLPPFPSIRLPPFRSIQPPTEPPPAAPHVEPSRSLWERLEEADAESGAPSTAEERQAVLQASEPPVLAEALATAPPRARGPSDWWVLLVIAALMAVGIGAWLLLR